MVECRQNIDPKDVLSEKCRFRFPSRYRDRTKLCFPTLGHTSSGKTFWLAMVYHQLKKGKRPQDVEMVNIRSSQSQLFDEIVSRIIEERLGPEGTQTAMLPYPLTFRFRDKDRWGVSSPLLTIFDYPGEVAKASDPNARHPMHAHRQRALDADGYLLFLDPTLPSETQATDLQGFRDDLCNLKGIEIGTKLRVPVAICLSKLDLLVKIEKLQGISGEAEHFYTELKKADPSGRALDARTIQKRSRLTEELCSVLWPQWEIQNTIEGLFGNRFLFFPLTPVGLENLGEEDLNKRMILPYAIHAPLLWLLHMNGYPVL